MFVGINDSKILGYMDRILFDNKPITADIFLTNYCNNNCPYCTYKRWQLPKDSKSVLFDDFVTYANRLKELGVLGFILTGGGEPTVAEDFDAIANYLEETKIPYGINTNFNLLKFIKPNYLKVSLDAWDEDSYEHKRGCRRYNQVRDNIKEYAVWKKTNNVKTSLGIQLLACSSDEVYNFYNANKDLDVDYIVIRPVESTDGEYYAKDFQNENRVNSIISAIESLKKFDKRIVLNYKWTMLHERFDSCLANWSQIAVNEYGEVMYCCHKPYEIVGHIMEKDILEKKAKFKTIMGMCDIPCRLTGPNCAVSNISNNVSDYPFI